MHFQMTLDQFLQKAGYTVEDWVRSGLDWANFEAIARHHDQALQILALHGGAIANRIQAFNAVHSVRWRIKDTFSLLKKLLRKNLETPIKPKWTGVTAENYRSVVSDLIGVRALHLLKEDCITVDEQIRATWGVTDTAIFKRQGDRELTEIIKRGASEDIHEAGYRSIHYAISYNPEKEPILVEIQVRTIFQEGWSEIDHKVRYPDFSDNELLTYYLSVFNGLSGTADDMGSFVIKLDQLIRTTDAALLQGELALAARDSDIESMQKEIDNLKSEGLTSKGIIDSLQNSINNIREKSTTKTKSIGIASSLGKSLADYYRASQLPYDDEYQKKLKEMFGTNSDYAKTIGNLFSNNFDHLKSLPIGVTQNKDYLKSLYESLNPSEESMKTLRQAADQIRALDITNSLSSKNTENTKKLIEPSPPSEKPGSKNEKKPPNDSK